MGRARNSQYVFVTFMVIVAVALGQSARAQRPRVGFYGSSCPNVETVVRSAVRAGIQSNPRFAPGLLRMHFHDCFVHGCDGSVLLGGTSAERTAVPNQSLTGFEVIDAAKTQLETSCPNTVSCADILALAARDVVVLTGGVSWAVPLGRLDGRISRASDVILPAPTDSASKQKQDFLNKNLNTVDLVTLAGGHTLGTAGCGTLRDRFYNFNNTGNPDPAIDPNFVPQIRSQCPLNGDASVRVPLDTGSVSRFDTSYFSNLRSGRGVLFSDQVLWSDPETRAVIERFLGLRAPALSFGPQFGRSMIKMSLIDIKTGSDGEIRRVCSAVN